MSLPVGERTLSPRELAAAIGASESSIKRWIDAGLLPASVTTGGHRRVELLSALRFLRDTKRTLLDPSLLGLTPSAIEALTDLQTFEDRLYHWIAEGKRGPLEQDLLAVLTLGLFEPADLFDGPLRRILERIGELWHGDHRGIYIEHHATVTLLAALDRVQALYEVPEDAPIAVGSSISGDPSLIPTKMAAIVLARAGFRAVDLGASTPVEALLEAADQLQAELVWLSVSYANEVGPCSEEATRLIQALNARGTAYVLGGREIHRLELPEAARQRIGNNMNDLGRVAVSALG